MRSRMFIILLLIVVFAVGCGKQKADGDSHSQPLFGDGLNRRVWGEAV
ncbi:MAG: hypothetical protein AB1420_07105 [Bacillota bacterium]